MIGKCCFYRDGEVFLILCEADGVCRVVWLDRFVFEEYSMSAIESIMREPGWTVV